MGTHRHNNVNYLNMGYLSFNFLGLPVVKCLVIAAVLLGRRAEAKTKLCRNFALSHSGGMYEEKVPTTFSTLCPPSSAPYSVYIIEESPDHIANGVENFTLLVCWTNDVKRFALQFHDNVHLETSDPVASVRTCVVTNDTIHYRRRHHQTNAHKLLLNISTASSLKFRGYFDTRKDFVPRHHFLTYKYNRDDTERVRRSVEDLNEVSDVSECGKSRSCVRLGSSDCEHFTCDYFLSTNVTGRNVEIELSAKTDGWVGLGLSSDTRMGGDEVIACYKADPSGREVRAGTFQNPYSHDQTKYKDNTAVKLVSSKIQDGYLYCRITRPEYPKDHQDLSSVWYQLYASGPVSQNGKLEKHHNTPSVSSKMRSLLHKYNVIDSSSMTTPSVLMTMLLLAGTNIAGGC